MSEVDSTLQDVAVVNETSELNEVGEPAQSDTTAAEAQPEPQEATEAEEAAEPQAEAEVEAEVAAQPEEVSQSDKIRKLLRRLDVPDKPNEQLMESIDEESILTNFPPMSVGCSGIW